MSRVLLRSTLLTWLPLCLKKGQALSIPSTLSEGVREQLLVGQPQPFCFTNTRALLQHLENFYLRLAQIYIVCSLCFFFFFPFLRKRRLGVRMILTFPQTPLYKSLGVSKDQRESQGRNNVQPVRPEEMKSPAPGER